MAKKEKTLAQKERDATQLRRLQTLMDVVFGVLLIRIFTLLPHPVRPETGAFDPLVIFTEGGENFIMFIVGFILITIYWIQNNKTTGNLVATDGKHTALSIAQLLFLLLYLYSVRLDMETNSDVLALFMQSVSLALAGFAGVAAWVYATKHTEMVSEAVSPEEANDLKMSILAEPLAAVVTIPFAFIAPGIWNLSWLSVIVFGIFLKRRHKKRFEGT
ncbi:MAG: TMEM175 family protein [Ignavibacteria bacterium]|nr:TMEM175 family protein [Ignavibacteria bacterium]